MTSKVANPLGKSLEELTRNEEGNYIITERYFEDSQIVKKTPDLNEAKNEADFRAMKENPDIDPKKYNMNSRDGAHSYFDVHDSKGNFIYTGKIPEIGN